MVKTPKLKKAPEPVRLNIACGQTCEPGWIGIDWVKCKAAPPIKDPQGNIIKTFKDSDIVHDLTKYPWPIKSNSIDEVTCSHYVEHIPLEDYKGKDRLFWFFDELHRVLKPGGKATIICPYYASVRCWQDPTHRRAISEATFLYANAGWRKMNLLDHYKLSCDFDCTPGYSIAPHWVGRSEESRNFAACHYINVITDIYETMVKRKPIDS